MSRPTELATFAFAALLTQASKKTPILEVNKQNHKPVENIHREQANSRAQLQLLACCQYELDSVWIVRKLPLKDARMCAALEHETF